ncbi:MAG: 16S rRNA (adenine(1518)-N(6)/adenine(1519)-N(6))-dimethyltransferase RsmA [Phycisphaerae bacterium]
MIVLAWSRLHGRVYMVDPRTYRNPHVKPDHVQTKSDIQQLLEAAGLRPRKRFGQHFLIDGNLMRRLAELADIRETDVIIEVGSGTGGLTDLLACRAGRVICIEIDRDLHAILQDRFATNENVNIICGDALASKHKVNEELDATLTSLAALPDSERPDVKLVANLPYQAATPLVMNLLVDFPIVSTLCFSVQQEVGLRMTAEPGSRDFGPLTLISSLNADVEIAARLRPEVFWPRPAVDSVLVTMTRKASLPIPQTEVRSFARFVRSLFDQRRKTLRAILRQSLGSEWLERIPWETLGIEPERRPQSLSLPTWLELYDFHKKAAGDASA